MSGLNVARVALLVCGCASVGGCGIFGSSDESKKGQIVPTAGGGTGGAAPVTGGTNAGGAGAKPNGGDSGVGSDGSAGAGAQTSLDCSGLPGSPMVLVPAAGGGKYCIDRTEVTQQDYAAFLKQATTKPGSEHAQCEGNVSYEPLAQEPGQPWEPVNCPKAQWAPESTPNHPVVCIDWCDAYAYCAWAGKRLCGKIGGGRGAPADATDASLSQWYKACSQGGKTKYPYGDTYDPLKCEGPEVASDGDGGFTKKAVGARVGCRGTAAPFTGLLDMSGSVQEYTDECDSGGSGTSPHCILRGGSWLQSNMMACDAWGYASGPTSDLGFRCCKD